MSPRRFEDWPGRLEAALAEAAGKSFAWGSWDCCLFAADVCLAMTGWDPAAGVRGRYATRGQAARLLRRELGGGLAAACAGLDMAEIHPLCARRGDWALVKGPAGQALGVVDLAGRIVVPAGPGRPGLARMPLVLASRAWRIG